ncbi:MAG: hypothetical protein K5796_11605 [Lachnospiraceae bacterium]|nr:hypothetical protein [Lachnospiraceae bacterium]
MNMKKCVYCGQFYDSDRSMICSNCGQGNPAVPQENPGVPQGNPAVPQGNPSSGPAIVSDPLIKPQHESGESFSDTTQSAGTSGGCKVSDYRFSRPTNVAIGLISTVAAGIITFGILFIIGIGTVGPFLRITNSSDIAIILYILGSSFLGLIIFSFLKGINDFICTKVFNFDLTRSVSFNLSGDNISVNRPWDGGRYSLSVNGLSRQIKSEDAQPFLSQLSMVDPIAYNRLNGMKNIVFDVNGRICRLFWFWVDEKNNYLFIDGIKVVDSGVQVVYELPAKNS